MTPEGSVQRAVTDLLTAERIWWMRCQAGGRAWSDKTGRKRVFPFGRPGMADLLALVDDRRAGCDAHGEVCAERHFAPVWIECKATRGAQSDAQKAFEAEVKAAGHVYLLVRDVAQVQKFLRRMR